MIRINTKSILVALALVGASLAFLPATSAEQTCDPALGAICTGDSGSDPFAACDGTWVDTWGLGLYYHQICLGNDGSTNVYVCPLAGTYSEDCRVL